MQNHKTVSLRKRKDRFLRQCLAVILSVALMVTMSGITPGSNWQAQAADELSVITEQPILLVSGDGIITGGDYTADNISYEKSYTLEELQDLEEITQLYSAINTSPTKSIYLGRGIAVDTLLQEANVPTDNYGNYEIDVVSSDGYTVRFDPTKTGDSATRGKPLKTPAFDAERYYFPNINELVVDLDDVGNYIYSNEDAASVGAESTKTILAWERGGERGFPDVVPTETGELASDEQPLLLMIGQQNAHEQNNPLFNKVVQKIMVGAALDVPLITIDGIDYTRSDLLMMERADRAYTYSASGEDKTDYARGVPLAALLSDYDDTDVVSFTAADGFTVTASGMTVGELISSNYMLAMKTATANLI